jgi:hypothetical protein
MGTKKAWIENAYAKALEHIISAFMKKTVNAHLAAAIVLVLAG